MEFKNVATRSYLDFSGGRMKRFVLRANGSYDDQVMMAKHLDA